MEHSVLVLKKTEITQFKEFVYFRNITSIPNFAFRWCKKLTDITFPNKLKTIGLQAFYECYHLTKIVIPDSVTDVGESAFQYCYDVTYIKLSNNMEVIKSYVCTGASNVKTLIIGENTKKLNSNALAVSGFTTLILPEKMEDVGYRSLPDPQSKLYIKNPNRVVGAAVWPFSADEDKIDESFTICVPKHLVEQYKKHQYWGVFTIVGYDF